MKAGIYHSIKNITIEELPPPVCGSRDVVVKNVYAGICGTDLHAYLQGGEAVGILPENQFGHELVGVVVKVGEKVANITKGMRVFVEPTKRKPMGQGLSSTQIADMTGAFSEYVLVEEAALDYNIYQLPDALPFRKAVLTEPMGISRHAVNRLAPKAGDKAVIYGAGTIGLGVLAALKDNGVDDVVMFDIKDIRLKLASAMGAMTFDSSGGDTLAFTKEKLGVALGNSGKETTNADLVIDAAGLPFVLDEFLKNAKVLSKFEILAILNRELSINPYLVLNPEATIYGSRGYTPRDIHETIAYLANPAHDVAPMITHVFPHSRLLEAFEQAADASSAVKVVIEYPQGGEIE